MSIQLGGGGGGGDIEQGDYYTELIHIYTADVGEKIKTIRETEEEEERKTIDNKKSKKKKKRLELRVH